MKSKGRVMSVLLGLFMAASVLTLIAVNCATKVNAETADPKTQGVLYQGLDGAGKDARHSATKLTEQTAETAVPAATIRRT